MDRLLPPETKCVIMMIKLSCPFRLNSSPCCKIWSEFSPSTLCHYRTQLLRKVVSWLDDSGIFPSNVKCELEPREICHISTWIIWWWLGHFSEKWKKWKWRLFNFFWCSWCALINSSAKHDPRNFSGINFFFCFSANSFRIPRLSQLNRNTQMGKKFRQNQRARRQASTANVITRFNWNQRRLCLGIKIQQDVKMKAMVKTIEEVRCVYVCFVVVCYVEKNKTATFNFEISIWQTPSPSNG